MRKNPYALKNCRGQTVLLLIGFGILGLSAIHPRSMAGQARAVLPGSGEMRLDEGLPIAADDDCDTNGEPEPCDIDCNANANPDDLDIYMATSRDCDADRMPDECQSVSPGDLDGDGIVGTIDRTMFAGCHRPLAGVAPGCESADQNGDGRVNCADWAVIHCAWTTGEAPEYARCRAPADITSLDD